PRELRYRTGRVHAIRRAPPAKAQQPSQPPRYGNSAALGDDTGVGTLHCNGKLERPADTVFLKLYADGRLVETLKQKPTAEGKYAIAAKLRARLVKYKVEFGCITGGAETVSHTAGNIVCGDAYIIDGQSNALATDTREESPRETHEWVRSYSRPRHYRKDKPQNLWCYPVWKAQREHKAELGWWGMELAKRLVASQKVPIFIVNAAVGGTRIDQHKRNEADPTDLKTIYGRMLWRVRRAKLTHGIRAILWHQGENDQGAAGPDGGYGWETYQRYFVDMSAAWKRDFYGRKVTGPISAPNLERALYTSAARDAGLAQVRAPLHGVVADDEARYLVVSPPHEQEVCFAIGHDSIPSARCAETFAAATRDPPEKDTPFQPGIKCADRLPGGGAGTTLAPERPRERRTATAPPDWRSPCLA
ncbi:MAG: sialate O-acetylesterase, partial [Planctomycetota bacterium]